MKIKIVILIILAILAVANLSSACISNGSENFNLWISPDAKPLEINVTKLEELCPLKKTAYEIVGTMGSHYDKWATVIIVIPNNDAPSIRIKLPFLMNKENKAIPAGIDPTTYNWKESVKTELLFLKSKGVLSLQDEEIEEISSLAGGARSIQFCSGKWQAGGINCSCGKEGSVMVCREQNCL